MAQTQTDGIMGMLDPFGVWKMYRDSAVDTWSKYMIDAVNSEDYAKFTGMILDQYLSMTQPIQDAVQKSMVFSLAYLNMPSREEVLSLAERLVHIETRLDDLDAETYDMHNEDQGAFRAAESRIEKVEGRIAESEEAVAKELRSVDRSLDKVLSTIVARLDGLEAAIAKTRSATPAKPEPKPEPKGEGERESKAKAEK